MSDALFDLAVGLARAQWPHEKPIKVCCSWCPNATQQTAEAERAGFRVSHGLCAACEARLLEEGQA